MKQCLTLGYSLEDTSDGFRYQDNPECFTILPTTLIREAVSLRGKGLLPAASPVIVNNNQEIAFEFPGLKLDTIRQLFENPCLAERFKLFSEPPLNIIDWYSNTLHYSNRLRFIYQNNQLLSLRLILISNQNNSIKKWANKNRLIITRKECVFVVREDIQKNNFKKAISLVNFFVHVNPRLCAVVYKDLYRYNLNHHSLWDHRQVYYRHQKQIINATPKYNLIGMGPYLYCCLQQYQMSDYSYPTSLTKTKKLFNNLLTSSSRTQKFINQLKEQTTADNKVRIEIESRGMWNKIAKKMTTDLLNRCDSDKIIYHPIAARKFNPQIFPDSKF